MLHAYRPDQIEPKWHTLWDANDTFKTQDEATGKPKYYILDMFPYPSGAGLHVGHPEGYTATDIIARYKRMQGFNVLHPMGWDAFGLPAERAAMRENRHPADITQDNIANFKKQIKRLGLSYDWSREICTSDPAYYRWTQWIFLQMVEKNLAYVADVPVNWCPNQGTVLANEEVVDGKYVETGDPVEKRNMRQWMLKITEYAERLLADLEGLDWPENVIEMQKNWIGKSEGATISFPIQHHDERIEVFTTKPETVCGVTFMVLAPHHPLLKHIVPEAHKSAVKAYCQHPDREKNQDHQEKTGVWTGAYAINRITEQTVPIWVADYVKLDYGSGAIMAVPAHDERDQAFASRYQLPIQPVLDEHHVLIHSPPINGLTQEQGRARIIEWLQEKKLGRAKTTYKLRDWLFSRQRYWGEPFPIAYDAQKKPHALTEDHLPIVLPSITEYKPTADGEPPLGRANAKWQQVTVQGDAMTRELNTMPQWAGSCWYYLRYMDPNNDQAPFSKQKEAYWGQVDLYVGGLEHAVSHLLYARFWHKVLYDLGLVSHKEPFKKLFNQGMILGVSYKDANGKYYHPDDIVHESGNAYSKDQRTPLTSLVEKMSKSKLNVVNPDDVVKAYGADALRLYEMFMGPLEATKPWQTEGVKGVYHFLQRVWQLSIDPHTGKLSPRIDAQTPITQHPALYQKLNQLIEKVTYDIEHLKFNTSIAKMMEFTHACKQASTLSHALWSQFILLLSPFAPHIAEEIWQRMGYPDSLAHHSWPVADTKALKNHTFELVFCINGKKVSSITADKNIGDDEAKALFLKNHGVQKKLDQHTVKKIIVVKNKLVNAVV